MRPDVCDACLAGAGHATGSECEATARFCRWWQDVRHPDLDGDGFRAGQLPAFGAWFDRCWQVWARMGRPERGERGALTAEVRAILDGDYPHCPT